MVRILFGGLAMVAAASCATPYRAGSMEGFFCGGIVGELACGGVTASALGGDAYRIEASLNRYSSQSTVQDYLLLRAAEVAIERGAIGFVIDGSRDTSREGLVVTGGSAWTTGHVDGMGNVSATTTYSPVQASSFIRPGRMVVVTLVRAPAPRGVRYFDASEVIAAIGPRVRREDHVASSAGGPSGPPIGQPSPPDSPLAPPTSEVMPPTSVSMAQTFRPAVDCAEVEAAWNAARQRGDWRSARLQEDIWRAECSAQSR